MPTDKPKDPGAPETGEETILPAEWRRRLAARRARDGGERPDPGLSESAAAAEDVRKRLREDIERARTELDGMLAAEAEREVPAAAVPAPADSTAEFAPGPIPARVLEQTLAELGEEMRAEIKKRSRKSERRIRKALRKEAKAAGRESVRGAADAVARSLELQVQAAEEELREHIHAQLQVAVQQARKLGEEDATRNLERVLDRILADLRSQGRDRSGR